MRRISAGERELNLRRCGIRDKGALVIAKTLIDTRNTKLKSINLWDNGIGDRGAMAFAETMHAAASDPSCRMGLERLILRNNGIRNKGALAIAAALDCNKTLTELDLSHNPIGAQGLAALKSAVARNVKHGRLRLFDLQCTAEGQGGFHAKSTNTGRHVSGSISQVAAAKNATLCPEPLPSGHSAEFEASRAMEKLTRQLEREQVLLSHRADAKEKEEAARVAEKFAIKAKHTSDKALYMGTAEEAQAAAERASQAATAATEAREVAGKAFEEKLKVEAQALADENADAKAEIEHIELMELLLRESMARTTPAL